MEELLNLNRFEIQGNLASAKNDQNIIQSLKQSRIRHKQKRLRLQGQHKAQSASI